MHLVTGNDPQLGRETPAQFQYCNNGRARHNGFGGLRDGVGGDTFNRAIGAYEDDVQRYHRVFHPETCDTRFWKRKNHTRIVGEFRPEHKTFGLL